MIDTPPLTSSLQWMFIDMDSFFASAERHLRPELRGRPVGVIPVESEGTCVIAASADAKKLGIKVGTPVREARALCPGIALVKARPAVYVELHKAILASVDRCAPVHKVYSIDEWSIRLQGPERTPAGATELARKIKKQMLADLSPWLTGSVGVAPSRLLAKIASDMDKPDGLTIIDLDSMPGQIELLRPKDLAGIGPSMQRRLEAAGITSVRALWSISRSDARRIWGSVQGELWWLGLRGYDIPEAPTARRTISHANVLAPEFRNDAGAHGILTRLVCKGAARLRHMGYVAERLHVHVRGANERSWEAEAALDATQETLTIVRALESVWKTRPWRDAAKRASWEPILKISMTLSGLTPTGSATGSLFEGERRLDQLSNAIDRINRRWGKHSVYPGAMHEYRHEMDDKIAFGRIPGEAG